LNIQGFYVKPKPACLPACGGCRCNAAQVPEQPHHRQLRGVLAQLRGAGAVAAARRDLPKRLQQQDSNQAMMLCSQAMMSCGVFWRSCAGLVQLLLCAVVSPNACTQQDSDQSRCVFWRSSAGLVQLLLHAGISPNACTQTWHCNIVDLCKTERCGP
jgi:hypothetical protein